MGIRRFLYSEAVPERSTWRYQVDIESDEGVPVDPGDVISVLLTLRDIGSDAIINSRDAIEVNNSNGGTVTLGRFVFQFEEADTAILGTASSEQRSLTLDWRLAGGGRITHVVTFYVVNLRDISA